MFQKMTLRSCSVSDKRSLFSDSKSLFWWAALAFSFCSSWMMCLGSIVISPSRKTKQIRLGSLKSGHLFTNGTGDRGCRRLTSLLKTVREWRITMRPFAHGFELCLATLEMLPQLCSSIRLLGDFGLQVALKGFKLEILSAGVAQVHKCISRWFFRSKAHR